MSETERMINSLKDFIEEQKTWLRNTLNSVGWSISDLEKIAESSDTELVACNVISEHRMPPESILKHEDKCEKRNGQYPRIIDILDLKLNEDEKKSILLADDFDNNSNDTIDGHSHHADKRKQQKESSSICLMELLAAERDAKRRRAAHRGKRVHSNKKTYNEILREVISSQMETLTDSVEDEDSKTELDKNEVVKKNIIEPTVGCYLGVGSKCYVGNPYKRWLSIEKEESELINEMKVAKDEKYSKKSSRRESSYETYKTSGKSSQDFSHKTENYKHTSREHFREKDYGSYKSTRRHDESRDHRSHKSRDRSRHSSRYNEEKYSDINNLKRKHDSHSPPYELTKHKKKHKKTSHKKKSRHRHSDVEDDHSHR